MDEWANAQQLILKNLEKELDKIDSNRNLQPCPICAAKESINHIGPKCITVLDSKEHRLSLFKTSKAKTSKYKILCCTCGLMSRLFESREEAYQYWNNRSD